MQALWSRAAQVHSSCRCRICLHPPNALVRRSTTAAPRRRVTAGEVFTACYTTILGTAAILDAKHKDARRRELDEKLEKARAGLQCLKANEAEIECVETEQDGLARSRETRESGSAGLKARESRGTGDILSELGQMASGIHSSRQRSSWLQSQIDWVEVEAAIAAEEKNPNIYLRHPKSDDQLQRTTLMVDDLVRQLLSRTRGHNHTETFHSLGPAEDVNGEKLLDEVEEIVSGSQYPSYEHPTADPESSVRASSLLSESFRRIFNRTVSPKEIVSKICHNLLLSSTPPNIHHYNALIAGFNRIQRPDLAQAVVDSYLNRVRWPATQQTMVCLLNHARGLDDCEQFRAIVGRMRGTVSTGLNFRNVKKELVSGAAWELWARTQCANRKGVYVERAVRGGKVFDSLIRGWLHFGKVDVASMNFVACIRTGQMVSIDTINDLLKGCLGTLDEKTARQMLKGLAKNFARFEAMMEYLLARASAQFARRLCDMFQALFDLCGLPYDPVVKVARQGYRDVVAIFTRLNIITQARADVKEIAKSSEEIKEELRSGRPFSNNLEKTLSLLARSEGYRARDGQKSADYRRIARLAMLTRRSEAFEEQTRRISAHAKVLIIKHKAGCDLDPAHALPPIDWHTRGYHDTYPAEFYALEAIELRRGPMSEEYIKLQLVSGMPDQELGQRLVFTAAVSSLSLGLLTSYFDANSRQRRSGAGSPAEEQIGQVLFRSMDERRRRVDRATRSVLLSNLFPTPRDYEQSLLSQTYSDWRKVPLKTLLKHHHQHLDTMGPLAQVAGEDSENIRRQPELIRKVNSVCIRKLSKGSPIHMPRNIEDKNAIAIVQTTRVIGQQTGSDARTGSGSDARRSREEVWPSKPPALHEDILSPEELASAMAAG